MSILDDEQLTVNEVAQMFKLKPKTINNWVAERRNGFPTGFKLGHAQSSPRRWMRSDIEAYILACRNNKVDTYDCKDRSTPRR